MNKVAQIPKECCWEAALWLFTSSWLPLLWLSVSEVLCPLSFSPLEHDASADIYICDVKMQLPLEQDAAVLDKATVQHLKESKHYTLYLCVCAINMDSNVSIFEHIKALSQSESFLLAVVTG